MVKVYTGHFLNFRINLATCHKSREILLPIKGSGAVHKLRNTTRVFREHLIGAGDHKGLANHTTLGTKCHVCVLLKLLNELNEYCSNDHTCFSIYVF